MTTLLLTALLALAGTPADLDAKYGFRDLAFDTAPTPDMAVVEEDGDHRCYTRPSDSLAIGGATVEPIAYCYWKDRLAFVLVRTKGYANARALRDALMAAYGPGYQSNRYSEDRFWFGKRATLGYDHNSVTDAATAIFSSKEVADRKKADEAVAAHNAASDL